MKVNELNINITKAVITEVDLKLTDEGLKVEIYGQLLTDSGKTVSTFNFSSDTWTKEKEIDVPAFINAPARVIFEQLTPIIYKKINGEFNMLKAKNE